MKKTIAVLCLLALLAGLTGITAAAAQSEVPEITAAVSKDEKYGAADADLSQEDFEAAGFTLGDSCDVTFGSGYTLEDVPYYNGYYVKTGDPVIVAYPGSPDILITFNNTGIWDSAGLTDGDTVTIRLHEAGAYSDIQDSLGQTYSFDRAQYTSDEEFCNFRAINCGELKENFLYRGASPADGSRGRAPYTDDLLEQAGIRFILDLADSEEDMAGYLAADDFDSPYTASLYAAGNMALLGMSSSYGNDDYKQALVSGLRQMTAAEGPVYIHCMEGKDRTGFVCMLLESFAGADYAEMRADYMLTYANYYGVTEDGTPEKYDAIAALYFDSFASYLLGTDDPDTLAAADYTDAAADYLRSGGMTDAELAALHTFLCG